MHPNDHVNLGQSSNDVIPSAIHVSASLEIHETLLPALDHLATAIERRARGLHGVVRTGRTHLMDAMPLRMGQEPGGWAAQVRAAGQPGRSIMPGKVNPVIPEAAAMACAQVIGHEVTIAVAGQSGSFQLNVMLPVTAYDLLSSLHLLAAASCALADKAIAGFEVPPDRIESAHGTRSAGRAGTAAPASPAGRG